MWLTVLHATHPEMLPHMDTERLRAHYLVGDLFASDDIRLAYTHVERLIIGGAVPMRGSLDLAAVAESGSERLLARRELGIINIGGPGRVSVDGRPYAMLPRDGLYIGQASAKVTFESGSESAPAKFYMVSAPAHAKYDTVKISGADAKAIRLGAPDTASQRTIHQYIHPDICRSSQLLMGITSLEQGSVWNTMPCHLHDRRSEVYFYFDMNPEDRVFHFMGTPRQTRHLVVANEEAVVSPPWSIHSGAGTSRYAFIWAMAGDNQSFDDMDLVPTGTLR